MSCGKIAVLYTVCSISGHVLYYRYHITTPYSLVSGHYIYNLLFPSSLILQHQAYILHVCTLTVCLLLLFTIYREDSMPFSCVLWVAILLLLNTLPLRWRNTCLLLMMEGAQLCTGQPRRVSCPWWSTSSNLADLM